MAVIPLSLYRKPKPISPALTASTRDLAAYAKTGGLDPVADRWAAMHEVDRGRPALSLVRIFGK